MRLIRFRKVSLELGIRQPRRRSNGFTNDLDELVTLDWTNGFTSFRHPSLRWCVANRSDAVCFEPSDPSSSRRALVAIPETSQATETPPEVQGRGPRTSGHLFAGSDLPG